MNFDKKIEQEERMKQILSNMDEENMKCADCGSNGVEYASINNGILICFSCYQKHKILGNQISYVISIGDKWDNYLIKYISSGGNSRFKQFCKNYHVENMDILLKYKTRACEYYREIIRSEVMGFDPPNNIEVISASQVLDDIPNNYPEFEGYTFVKQVDMNALENKYNKKKNNKVISSISGFFSSFSKKVNDAAESFVGKVSELKNNNSSIQKIDTFFGNYYNKINNNNENKFQKDSTIPQNGTSSYNNNEIRNGENNLYNVDKNINENIMTNPINNDNLINKNNSNQNNNIFIDSKEINEIIKNAKETHNELINKEEIKKENNLKNEEEIINNQNIKEKEQNIENKEIKEEKKNEYGLDDNDELLKKIAEIEGTK